MNLKVNYGLWVTMTCYLWADVTDAGSWSAVLLWSGVWTVGEVVRVWGHGQYGKSLRVPLSFAVNLKLL